jgi:integrase
MKRPKACPYRRRDGTYWARIRYTDESGKTRDEVARAESVADADAKSIELLRQYEADHGISIESPTPITFNKFAELFIPHIERQRSYQTTQGFLRTLRSHFGNKRLTSITYSDVREYAKKRRKAISLRTGKKFKTASVNREIALLSSMFKEAIEQGFAVKNPTQDGARIIKPEEETRRNRILSEEEEERLLAVCIGRRAHLRPVIRAALDTGATKSQLLRLTWSDLHIGLRSITIRLSGNKTVKRRMSDDLANILAKSYEELLHEFSHTPTLMMGQKLFDEWLGEKYVFRDFKTSFSSACRAAKIQDLRFNDLRRTYDARRQASLERYRRAMAFAAQKRESEESS